jgi:hypothetical protein
MQKSGEALSHCMSALAKKIQFRQLIVNSLISGAPKMRCKEDTGGETK